MENPVIVVGDVQQVAEYVQGILQIKHTLQEIIKVNDQLKQAFAKLQADIDARNQADTAKDQQIATLTQQNQDLAAQVNSLTAAADATNSDVLAAVNAADSSVTGQPAQ